MLLIVITNVMFTKYSFHSLDVINVYFFSLFSYKCLVCYKRFIGCYCICFFVFCCNIFFIIFILRIIFIIVIIIFTSFIIIYESITISITIFIISIIIELIHSKTILEITVETEPQPVALDFKNLSQYSSCSK